MDSEQAEFFRSVQLPVYRDFAAEEDEDQHNPSPLRDVLRQVLRYVDYLEGAK